MPHDPKLLADLKLASELAEAGELDDAWDIVNRVLFDDPNDPRAIMLATHIHDKSRRLAVAYQFAERGVHIAPNIAEMWLNFGRISDELYRLEDAEMAYRKAIGLARKPKQQALCMTNLGALYITAGRWAEAEAWSKKALELDPDSRKAKGNVGMACLAQRKWSEGWEGYEAILGSEHRKFIKYGDEPQWEGEKGKTVAAYGEQGLGDEVSFASMFPDLIRDSGKVIIDCDARLKNLFQRSFPAATVYGTRSDKQLDWKQHDQAIDASITAGGLGKHYRKVDSDFPGTPYLVADPERVLMWRALFERQRPALGVAWSGGVQWTGAKFRRWTLAEMQPFFSAVPAHWVSLQYKDAAKEIADFTGARIAQYPFATLTKDYDDTAALVASLDLVICMQTAVAHLAGALGKDCWVFVPKTSQWRYGQGDKTPWYKSVTVWRQREDGSWPIEEAARILKLRYGSRMAA